MTITQILSLKKNLQKRFSKIEKRVARLDGMSKNTKSL
jgi:hypothetical protein